jgi:hypothetical protein
MGFLTYRLLDDEISRDGFAKKQAMRRHDRRSRMIGDCGSRL